MHLGLLFLPISESHCSSLVVIFGSFLFMYILVMLIVFIFYWLF